MATEIQRPGEPLTKAELPSLTPKEHAFVDAFLRSSLGELLDDDGNPVTTLVGIRRAAGYASENMSMAAQYVDASRLAKKPKIKLWLDFVLQEHRSCTLESHLERLNRLGIKAERKGDINTARLCETSRAEAAGVKISRHEVTHFDARSKEEVERYINERFGQPIDITPETVEDSA